MNDKKIFTSILGGTGIALISGIIENKSLEGAIQYGWPMAWRILRVLAPEHSPLRIIPLWFVFDAAFWAVIVYLILRYTRNQ